MASSAQDDYGETIKDFVKGVASGAIQAPFDFGAAIAPGIGLIAPTTASALVPLDERVKALLAASPLATKSDAGDVGSWFGGFLAPGPGGAKIATESSALAEALASRLLR
jgi:hypothetical protein